MWVPRTCVRGRSYRGALKPVQVNEEFDRKRRAGAGNPCDFGIESVTENMP